MKNQQFAILICTIFFVLPVCAQDLNTTLGVLNFIKKHPYTTLPYSGNASQSLFEVGFASAADIMPLKTYLNMNLTRSKTESYPSIIRRFEPTNGSYQLITLYAGESEPTTQTLSTYTTDGQLIDYIESAIYFDSVVIKQYSIDRDMKVTVYYLKVLSPDNAQHGNFSSVTAQRIDTEYQITPQGRFTLLGSKEYQQKLYTKTYLDNTTIRIQNGGEIPIISNTADTTTYRDSLNILYYKIITQTGNTKVL